MLQHPTAPLEPTPEERKQKAEKELLLSRFPRVGAAFSFAACTATLAFMLTCTPAWQIGTFLVAPYILHKLALWGANEADKRIQGKAELTQHQQVTTRLVKILNPTWPFFAAFLTPCMTAFLTPILAPLAPYLWDNAAKRFSIILVRGAMYTVFMENTDRFIAKPASTLGIKIEARRSHATIWQHDLVYSILTYTIIQALQPGAGMFAASTFSRAGRILFIQDKEVNVLEAFIRGATYGAIYTGSSLLRAEIMLLLEASLTNSAFAALCLQNGLPMAIFCSFISEYCYVITRDFGDFLSNYFIFEASAPGRELFTKATCVIGGQVVKAPLDRTWNASVIDYYDNIGMD